MVMRRAWLKSGDDAMMGPLDGVLADTHDGLDMWNTFVAVPVLTCHPALAIGRLTGLGGWVVTDLSVTGALDREFIARWQEEPEWQNGKGGWE